jgi:DNA repair protein RecO (recombination protein O)
VPYVRTPALILHSFPYGDTSRILRLLTPGYGVRAVIAKGARSPRSRFGGILEPFTEGEAQFNLRENRDLYTLSGFTLVRSRQAIGRDLLAFTGASVLAEIVMRFATDESNPELYAFMTLALDRFAKAEAEPAAAAVGALWNLICLFGFQPEMEQCVSCGRQLDEDEPSRFDVEAGGVACFDCRPVGRTLPAPLRHEILAMSSGVGLEKGLVSRQLHADLLHVFLSTHLFQGKPLRSFPMFLEQLR